MALVQISVSKLVIGDRTTWGTFDGVVKRTAKFITIRFQIGKSRDYLPEYKVSKKKMISKYVND